MSLNTRVVRLESGLGSDRDLRDAEELLRRHAEIAVAEIFGFAPDPDEAVLMKGAEKSGRIAAAEDLKRRYWRVRGIDIDERHRRETEGILGQIREIFGLPAKIG
jgi:hypothetical protein